MFGECHVPTLFFLLQALKVVLVLWANLAGLDLLVSPALVVTLDPLVSLDPLENKVSSLIHGVYL